MTVAFAIGAIVLAMAYALGPISGGHFNPAVTCGPKCGGALSVNRAKRSPVIAKLIGGIAAAAVFYVILSGASAGK